MLGVFLTVLHVIVCFGIILVVLLQSGKGGGLAGSIGGGSNMMTGAQAAFGGRGTADLLSKATTGLAIGFMVMSLILTVYTMHAGGGKEGGSKIREMLQHEETTAMPFNATINSPEENLDNVEPGPASTQQPAPTPATQPESEKQNPN